MIESLIKAGAMDSLEGTRARRCAAVEGAMEAGQRAWRDRESGQVGLFGERRFGEEHADMPLPNVPDWTDKEKLAGEKELLGFWVTGHPLDRYEDKIAELATHDTLQPRRSRQGRRSVTLCGVLTGITRKRNQGRQAVGRDGPRRPHRQQWKRWSSPPATNGWRARWWRIRPCWCAAWCCPKRTPRPSSPCRTSWRWIMRASICLG